MNPIKSPKIHHTYTLRIPISNTHALHSFPKGRPIHHCHRPHPPSLVITAATATSTDNSNDQYRKTNFKDTWDETGPAWGDHGNFPIRQAMLDCNDARQLLTLLRHHHHELLPADTAAAWHVAVQLRLISMARIDHPPHAELTRMLLSLTEQHSQNMDATCLSTTAWALAASSNGTKEHIENILIRAQDEIITFRPQELCILFWAAHTHDHASVEMQHAVFSSLSHVVEAGMQLDHFTAHDLSVLIWSMGRSHYIDPLLLAATEAECLVKASGFDTGDISRLMHGFSMLKYNPTSLLPVLSDRIESKMDDFSPDDITLFMISLGKLGIEPESVFMKKLCRRMTEMVPPPVGGRSRRSSSGGGSGGSGSTAQSTTTTSDDHHASDNHADDNNNSNTDTDFSKHLHPTHAAHIMWALGKMDHRPTERGFVQRIHRHLASAPGVYSGEEVNAILWSTSRLGIDITTAALHASMQRLTYVAHKEDHVILASALRSVSSLLSRHPAMLQEERDTIHAFVTACLSTIEPHIEKGFSPDDVALLVVALGTMETFPSPTVASKLQRMCTQSVHECSSVVLPRLAWATVRLRWTNIHKLMDGIATASTARVGLLSPEGISQLAWSFASIDRPYSDLIKGLASQCTTKGGFDKFSAKDKARMAWAFAHTMRFGQPSEGFLLKFLQSITARDLNAMDGLAVSAVVWACLKCSEHPGDIIDNIAVHINKNLRKFSVQQLGSAVAVLKKHRCRKVSDVESIAQHAMYTTHK